MRRCYCLTFLLLFLPVYSYEGWDDDDDFEEEEESISLKPSPVIYGGMEIECVYGCGDPTSNSTFRDIAYILQQAVNRTFRVVSPVYLGWESLNQHKAFPFDPWIKEWFYKYEVYDWESAKGFYLQENPRKEYTFTSYPQFLELASALRRDTHFYSLGVYEQELKFYRSTLQRLRKINQEGTYGNIAFTQDGQLELLDWGTSCGNSKSIKKFIEMVKFNIDYHSGRISNVYPFDYEKNRVVIEEAIRQIDDQFRSIFSRCLRRHQPEGIAFSGAIEGLIGQNFYEAIEQIRWLIETAETHHVQEELLSKLYLLKGQVESEYGLYAEAVIGLTTAIQKNPALKEAYFERAAAYFELGLFDRAIEDYLASDMRPSYFENPCQLGLGIAAGIVVGSKGAALEFIPTMVGTVQGLGAGIWALLNKPVATSKEFVHSAVQCIEYIRSHSTAEIIQDMVPELKTLLQNYDQLDDFQKGKLIGHVVGKYGTDIFLTKQSVAFIKLCQNLKNANKALTLDALASSETTQVILAETEKRWSNVHIEKIRNGEVKIVADKQGKHTVGHRNYEDLVKKERHPSLFSHPDPQKLLNEFGGTGIKAYDCSETVVGMAGYVEIVDFKQFIGYSVLPDGTGKTATTLGKIHYANEGAHIIPFVKR